LLRLLELKLADLTVLFSDNNEEVSIILSSKYHKIFSRKFEHCPPQITKHLIEFAEFKTNNLN